MSKPEIKIENGISFTGLLTIVFITLKLMGVIDWHWAWVLSPLWLPFVGAFAILIVIVIVALVVALFGGKE